MFDRSFEKEGIDSITYVEFQSAEAIKQCAISGIGIAFLPEIVAESEVERGELVVLPWQIPDLQVYTQMLWHKEKAFTNHVFFHRSNQGSFWFTE
ncbi:LysR family transcriptional regulator [Paenibacillus illinoisensis]|uniref:LysR family transcriptional regulator n=1 Tax=Paenibacillus illinoisensis TaxID=59845 RepID=A0A2W0CBE4_9BACL|nr:LysR family transcriptional regulator [Paenibacillus illinoisensis]